MSSNTTTWRFGAPALLFALCAAAHAQSPNHSANHPAIQKSEKSGETGETTETATLPTVSVQAAPDRSFTESFAPRKRACVTRTNVDAKDTPFTISQIDTQAGKNRGHKELGELLEGVAGVDAGYGAWYDSIFIRGFEADVSDAYRDGIRTSGHFRRSTTNVERIEILKGPASVLYGKSQGGGVINMVSKKANFESGRSLSLNAGTWERRGIALDINHVFSDQLAARVTANLDAGNSFRALIESRNRMISPSMIWKSANGLWQWEGQYTYDRNWYVPDRGPAQSEYDKMRLPYDYGFARPGDYIDNDLNMATSKLKYQFHPAWNVEWTLGWLTQHHDFDHFYLGTYDARTRRFNPNYSWVDNTQKTLASNLVTQGEFHTGAMRHRLTAGYDYSREKSSNHSGAQLFTTTFGVDPYDRSTWPANTHRLVPGRYSKNTAKSHSLFFNDVMDITQALKLAVGGRHDHYDFVYQGNKYSGSSFSPSVGVVWTAAPGHNVYASFARSFSPLGGNGYLYSSPRTNAAHLDTEPQYNRQFEIGIKSDWLDERLSSTLSIYQITKHNIRYQPDPTNDPDRYEVAGKHRNRGVELEVTGRVAGGWHARASIGLMQPKVAEDVANPARVGRYLYGTSKRQAGMAARYVAPAEQWFAELGLVHVSRRFPNPPADYATGVAGYTRFDLMAGYRFAPNVSAILSVQNLADKSYWRNAHMPGQPRSLMARLNYDF